MSIETFIITIMDLKESFEVSKRCKDSCILHGVSKVSFWNASTPKNTNLEEAFKDNQINLQSFLSYPLGSRPKNVMGCFLSHYRLWKHCIEINKPILILEHDAVMTSSGFLKSSSGIPQELYRENPFLLSIGHPSYGRFNTPSKKGIVPLVSKRYLPGAHAYLLNPKAAIELIKKATIDAIPTDVFIGIKNFRFLHEYYPWMVEAQDTFTTLQSKEQGLDSKHSYRTNPDSYRILEI